MAAREGQGLQIAVIIFAFLTILLAITTYVFYAQSQTASKERESALAENNRMKDERNKHLYRIAAFKYVLGMPDATKEDVDLAAGQAGSDGEAEQVLADFNAHRATIGSQLAPEGAGYRTLQENLLAALRKKNASVADHLQATREAEAQQRAVEQSAKERVDAHQQAVDKATAEKNQAVTVYTTLRDEIAKEKEDLLKTAQETEKRLTGASEALAKRAAELQQASDTSGRTIETLRGRVKELQAQQVDLVENPDGKILSVNQRQRLVWINLGRADGLLRQTTFSVYPHNEQGLASAQPKARIEVVNIGGDHMAEARILEDKASAPILKGDIIHTPAWSPGQRIHFAMAGKMDVNGDGIDDYETVRNVILLNGGVIDAEVKPDGTRLGELTINTRYLVMGEGDTGNSRALDGFTQIQKEIVPYGIEPLPYRTLLSMMGWKSEERTVGLAGTRSAQFRQRLPGKAKAAPEPPAGDEATPATGSAPAAGGDVDPFGAPSGGAADPFGAPAAADPFGAPAAADPFGAP